MKINPLWVILGVFAGSSFITMVGWLVTAGLTIPATVLAAEAAPAPTPIPEAAIAVDMSVEETNPEGAETPNTDVGDDWSQTECQLSSGYPDSILQWCSLITHYANKRGLSPNLIAALIWQESGGNHLAYSKSGAVGLMQVMPSDGLASGFMCKNGPCFTNRPPTDKLQDPEFNISYGTKMLAGLLNRHGDIRDALKSYGPMDVGYYYADKVLGIFNSYAGGQ